MNMVMIFLILYINILIVKIRVLRKLSYYDNIFFDRFYGIFIQNDGFKRRDCFKYKWQFVIDKKDNLNFFNFKLIYFRLFILFIYMYIIFVCIL